MYTNKLKSSTLYTYDLFDNSDNEQHEYPNLLVEGFCFVGFDMNDMQQNVEKIRKQMMFV